MLSLKSYHFWILKTKLEKKDEREIEIEKNQEKEEEKNKETEKCKSLGPPVGMCGVV
jgi:hypothetical protein